MSGNIGDECEVVLRKAKLGSVVVNTILFGFVHAYLLYKVVFDSEFQDHRMYQVALLIVFIGGPVAFIYEVLMLKSRLERLCSKK